MTTLPLTLPDTAGIAEELRRLKQEGRLQDIIILTALRTRLHGRRPRRIAPRLQRFHSIIYRDPVLIVQRFLRRHTTGPWHRGGHHVARLHGGPGIALHHFRNDRRTRYDAKLINA